MQAFYLITITPKEHRLRLARDSPVLMVLCFVTVDVGV